MKGLWVLKRFLKHFLSELLDGKNRRYEEVEVKRWGNK